MPVLVSWESLGIKDFGELEEIYRPYTIRPPVSIGAGGRRTIEEVGFSQGNFGEWFNTRNDKFKLDLLGKNRFELIKSGKVKWDDLVTRDTAKLVLLKDLL